MTNLIEKHSFLTYFIFGIFNAVAVLALSLFLWTKVGGDLLSTILFISFLVLLIEIVLIISIQKYIHTKIKSRLNLKSFVVGWIVILVLGFLYPLYNWSSGQGTSLGTNVCIEGPGFMCTNLVYTNSTGLLTLTIRQGTGVNWTSANILFTNSIVSSNIGTCGGFAPTVGCNANVLLTGQQFPSGLVSGQSVTVFLPTQTTPAVGDSLSGYIWAQYTTLRSTTFHYTRIGTLNVKAT